MRRGRSNTAATSSTAPTPSSASTTCATTCPSRWSTASSAGHHFAIVDEVDNILIDEARTPLIISGAPEQAAQIYYQFARLARQMEGVQARDRLKSLGESKDTSDAEYDYEYDEKHKTVSPTERGVKRAEEFLDVDNLYLSEHGTLVNHLSQALKAESLYKKDKDYAVVDGQVMIIDEFTGRILEGRRWSEGLHQAVEAKEGVAIGEENQTLATITLQNYFRLYDKLGGMTGTALTEATEFMKIYKVPVVEIPTNRPMVRADHNDQIFKTKDGKWKAVLEEIFARHEKGQPILVGTVSVEVSEMISGELKRHGVEHAVLNAKPEHAEKEGERIAEAGRKGAVMIATNMAGRGVDIKLGGDPEHLAMKELKKQGLSHGDEGYEEALAAKIVEMEPQCKAEAEEVRELGGLYICGTERHESRRIDNQLRGRSGRQGDPGETRFFLSAEDDVIRLFAGDRIYKILDRLGPVDEEGGEMPLEAKMLSKTVEGAQKKVEEQNFLIRKRVLEYDDVMNEQRRVVYKYRREILEGRDMSDIARDELEGVIERLVDEYTPGDDLEDWDMAGLEAQLRQIWPVGIEVGSMSPETVDREKLKDALDEDSMSAYDDREQALGEELMRYLERSILLQVIDNRWREHLYDMDYLREGIHLRGFAQIDPLVAYKNEGFAHVRGADELDLGGIQQARLQRPDRSRSFAGAGRRLRRQRRRAADRARLLRRHPGRPAVGPAGGGRGRSASPKGPRGPARQRRRGARGDRDRGQGRARERNRPQRPLLVRQREKVQEVPRRLAGAR